MPVSKLFVEGELDAELLFSILQGSPPVAQGGSKTSLKPRTRNAREGGQQGVVYLRDRDFDFDPPENLLKPTIDSEYKGQPLGWRWCRHEIENYLIEPDIIHATTGWPSSEIQAAILEAAKTIRNYEAARWTVGFVRRALPPNHDLNTKPKSGDFALPASLDITAVRDWAVSNIEAHQSRIEASMNPVAVQAALDSFFARFDDTFIADLTNILLWFSGKDLLAGMADWLVTRSFANPGEFRKSLRDWIISNPDRAIALLPEWKSLIEILRA